MEYTVEKFINFGTFGKSVSNLLGFGGDVGGGVVRAGDVVNPNTVLTAPTLTRVGGAGNLTNINRVTGNVVDGGGNLTDLNRVTGNVGGGADAARIDPSEATTRLATNAATNPSLSSKIRKVMLNNPGMTLGAILAAAAAGTLLGLAGTSLEKSNNQPLTIINSYVTKGGDEGDVTIEYTADSGVTVVDGDKVIVNQPNDQENLLSSGQVSNYFVPSTIYGQTKQVKKILSPSSIVINHPGLVNYAKKGVLTLQTTMDNRLLNESEKGVKSVTSASDSILETLLDPIKNKLGPYLIYAEGFCCCICCLILISIIYKISKMAK